MKRTIVTPAVLAPAALVELKDWLGIHIAGEDSSLTTQLRAALETCEAFTGTMPIETECEEILAVCGDWQRLQARPVLAITAVEGLPAQGARFALPADAFAIEFDADGSGRVRMLDPGSASRIAIRFTAGLAPDWTGLPDGLRHGIVRLAAHQYRQREAGDKSPVPPAAVAALWRPWRRLRLA